MKNSWMYLKSLCFPSMILPDNPGVTRTTDSVTSPSPSTVSRNSNTQGATTTTIGHILGLDATGWECLLGRGGEVLYAIMMSEEVQRYSNDDGTVL